MQSMYAYLHELLPCRTLVAVEVLCSLRQPHSHDTILPLKQGHQHSCELVADRLVLLDW